MDKILLLFIGLFISVSCTSSTAEVKMPTSEVTEVVRQQATAPTELTVDQLMAKIDAETAEFTPEESDVVIQDIHACNVKDYKGIKKYVFCFDGGMNVKEGTFYYAEGKAIAARYALKRYNASPANIEEYDETKTFVKEVVLYFKEGDLRNFDKVLDANNQAVILDAQQSKKWEILIAALQ